MHENSAACSIVSDSIKSKSAKDFPVTRHHLLDNAASKAISSLQASVPSPYEAHQQL
jgi:hypothetical protein